MSRSITATAAFAASVLLGCLALPAAVDAQSIVPPLPVLGPHPVACSNLEQDFSRVTAGTTAGAYWRGLTTKDAEYYASSLLVDPNNAHAFHFVAPGDSALYGRWAGQTLDYVALTCYPTTSANARADYPLPGGKAIPRMQRGAEAPILPASPARLPVLLYSHGYGGSPLSGTYLDVMLAFASWGFVTIAPFHGDLRYSFTASDAGSGDSVYVPVWEEFVAMQATRPLSLSAALDRVAGDAQWASRIDLGRVGAFGISQGGESIMLLGGAQLTYSLLTQATKQVTRDDRVRAAVGYVPYLGIEALPAFGSDQQGVATVTLPYLAMSGTEDPIAPIEVTQRALEKMAGPHALVQLAGQGHDLEPSSTGDITTWALTFYAAWLANDTAAQNRLVAMQSVEGGLDDLKRFYVGGPPPVSGTVVDTIEYHHAGLDHYFITAFPDEVALLDAGVAIPGWKRTGYAFRTWQAGTGSGSDACRFYGTPGRGPNSHFYTISAHECDVVRANPDWTFEALAFRAIEPLATGCEAGYRAVTRLYNNGMGGEANHRYLTDAPEVERMVAKGWLVEGTVMCTPP